MDFTTTLLSTALSLIWFAAEQREQSPGGFRKARRIGGSLLGVPIFVLLVVLGGSARATTYAVSPTGSDGASGLLSAPWKTIGHAMSVVAADDTVNITAGTYNETPVMSRSGQSGQPINFVGVGNPIMVTSGDVFKVTGSFIILQESPSIAPITVPRRALTFRIVRGVIRPGLPAPISLLPFVFGRIWRALRPIGATRTRLTIVRYG